MNCKCGKEMEFIDSEPEGAFEIEWCRTCGRVCEISHFPRWMKTQREETWYEPDYLNYQKEFNMRSIK